MTKPHKDGVDKDCPTVRADSWRECLQLGCKEAGGITFACDDGWLITFGKTIIVPRKD